MKTKLLLLLLFTFLFGNAQINVSESFETQFPMGWSTTGQSAGFGRGTSSYTCDQSYTMTAGLNPSNNHAMIITSNYISDGNAIVASFQYNRGIGAITGNVFFYYDVNNSESWQQIATSSDLSPGCKTLYGAIAGNLVPAGSNVRFRMQINSTSGVTVFVDNFKAEQKPFAFEYTFDNTTANTDGLFPFTVANTSYVTDRNGSTNAALQINANVSGSQAVISLLPKNSASRTFSLWYKTNANLNANVFTYGTACQDCNFGTYLGGNGNPVFQSYISDTNFGGNYAANTWHHIVVTYNGTQVKMYMNGVLIGIQAYTLVTGNNSSFRLGGNTSTLTVDDLRMYDRAITDAEVANLFNHNQIENPTPPVISAISETPATSTVTVNYTLTTTNSSATSLIKYGLSDTSLTSQITGFPTNNTATNSITINALLPSTTYFYQIEATNNDGTTLSSIESFTTLVGQTIAEYSFDNTYNNLLGNSPFTSNSGSTFVNDRNGNPNASINLTNAGIEASIPTLPFNGSSRTISLWAKLNTLQSYNHTFSYGGIFTGLGFAGSFNETAVDFFGYSDDFNLLSANAVSTWYHFVYTYDGVNVKVYKNGTLLGSVPKNLNTAVYDVFSLGRALDYSSTFNGAIDDLKIYNYALSQAEVTSLFTNNTLLSQNFSQNNLQVALYPNPVNDILNIQIEKDIQSIEIYNIQGQKVMSSNQKQINVSDLAAGMYMVRILDIDNNMATKKIVIN